MSTAITLFMIPELYDHVALFIGDGRASLRALNMALAHCKKTNACVPLGSALCSPADCVQQGLLHKECRIVCEPFLKHGLLALLRLTTNTLLQTVGSYFAAHVDRSVMHVHLLHFTHVTAHKLSTITLRFTHCAAGSVQWWMRQRAGPWVTVDTEALPERLLVVRSEPAHLDDDAVLGMGFDLTGKCTGRTSSGAVWLSQSRMVASNFHGRLSREASVHRQLRYTPWATETPWIGYHLVAGRISFMP